MNNTVFVIPAHKKSSMPEAKKARVDGDMLIPFDDIVLGASVRFTVIDGVQYLSVRDIIMHLCDKNNNDAGEVWRNLSPQVKDEFQEIIRKYQFSGRGQKIQPVITFPGALKLAMFLPGEKAKKSRGVMANILQRYFAGDQSLVGEIRANAASNGAVAQMARASVADEVQDGGEAGLEVFSGRDLEVEERRVHVASGVLANESKALENTRTFLRGTHEFLDVLRRIKEEEGCLDAGTQREVAAFVKRKVMGVEEEELISISGVAKDLGVESKLSANELVQIWTGGGARVRGEARASAGEALAVCGA
jgi:hypothetical protein